MATDPQTLLSDANCFACYSGSIFQENLLELELLRRIVLAQNPSADVNPDGLLAFAACYECFAANNNMENLLELALLDRIAQAISPAPPSGDSFRLSDVGDTRISAVGDNRIWQ